MVHKSVASPLQIQLQAFTVGCQVYGQTATSNAAHLCKGDPKLVAVPEHACSWADTTPPFLGKPAEVLQRVLAGVELHSVLAALYPGPLFHVCMTTS